MMHRTLSLGAAILLLSACVGPEERPDDVTSPAGREARPGSPAPSAPVVVPSVLSLGEAIALARAANPRILAALREVEAGEGRLVQAGLWPNPSLGLGAEDGLARKSGGFGGENKLTARFSQPLPIWGRLGAQEGVARAEIEVARLEILAVEREIATDVRLAFYRAVSAREAVRIAREGLEVAELLFAVADDRVESGAASEIERVRAQVERSKASVALSEAEQELEAARKELATAIGIPEASIADVAGELRDDLPPLRLQPLAEAVARHPGIEAAARRVAVAQAEMELARVERLPEPEVDLGIGREHRESEHEIEDGLVHLDHEDEAILEWGLTIPLPVFDRNQGRIAEAAARVNKARAAERVEANRLMGELQQALVSFERSRGQWEEYRTKLVPEAERALELIRGGYQEGKFTQLEVLDSQRAVLEARLAQAGKLREAISALARIQGIAGPEATPDPLVAEERNP